MRSTSLRLTRDTYRPLLLDGAMGTELIGRGLVVRQESPEGWCLSRPDDVRAVHAAHSQAGAEAVHTCTFGGLRTRLARFGLEERQAEVIETAVRLAREGAPGRVVIGSLGPSGETLPLSGRPDLGWLEDEYARAAERLAGAGVDAIHLETQFHPLELEVAILGARAGAGRLPLIASMTLMPGVTGLETPHGVPIARMIAAALAAGPDALGVNCSIEAERMLPAVEQLRQETELPVWAKPQAKVSQKCATWRPSESPQSFARHARALVRAGASAIGGCCGIGPDGIVALKAALMPEDPRPSSAEERP